MFCLAKTRAGEEGDCAQNYQRIAWNLPDTQARYENFDKKTENLARIISDIPRDELKMY